MNAYEYIYADRTNADIRLMAVISAHRPSPDTHPNTYWQILNCDLLYRRQGHFLTTAFPTSSSRCLALWEKRYLPINGLYYFANNLSSSASFIISVPLAFHSVPLATLRLQTLTCSSCVLFLIQPIVLSPHCYCSSTSSTSFSPLFSRFYPQKPV